MSKPENPVHPRRIKEGDVIYTEEGVKHTVVGYPTAIGGVYVWMTKDENGKLSTYEWDSHSYGEHPEPFPIFYRNKPKF